MKKKKHYLWLLYMAAIAVIILVLSLLPELPNSPVRWDFPGKDKVQHGLAYVALGWGLFGVFCSAGRFRNIWICWLGGFLYGGIIELLQHFTGRTPDLLDWGADGLGVAVGLLTAALAVKIYRSFSSSRRARRAVS